MDLIVEGVNLYCVVVFVSLFHLPVERMTGLYKEAVKVADLFALTDATPDLFNYIYHDFWLKSQQACQLFSNNSPYPGRS